MIISSASLFPLILTGLTYWWFFFRKSYITWSGNRFRCWSNGQQRSLLSINLRRMGLLLLLWNRRLGHNCWLLLILRACNSLRRVRVIWILANWTTVCVLINYDLITPLKLVACHEFLQVFAWILHILNSDAVLA